MLGSIAGFTVLAVAARELGDTLDSFEMMLYRSAIGFAAVAAFILLARRQREVTTDRLGLHLLRNLVHYAGQNFWLIAIGLIPLAQVFAVEFSYPLLVALAAPLLLGERLTRPKAFAAALGFTGIVIVAQPFGSGGLSPGVFVALAAAFGFAGAALVTKRLTRTASVTCILFWLTLMQTGFSLLASGYDGTIALPRLADWHWVLLLGLSGIVAHVGLTKALTLAPASVVTPMDFVRLPVIALVGATYYGEPFDPWVLVGGATILVANWLNIRSEARVATATA